MALVPCPDCGTKVSDQAPACVKCGRPQAKLARTVRRAAPPRPPRTTREAMRDVVFGVAATCVMMSLFWLTDSPRRKPARTRSDPAPQSRHVDMEAVCGAMRNFARSTAKSHEMGIPLRVQAMAVDSGCKSAPKTCDGMHRLTALIYEREFTPAEADAYVAANCVEYAATQ